MTSTSTTPIASTIIDEEEWECLFHTRIWVQNNPLHLIVDNSSQKNFVFEYLVKKLGLFTTPHPQPYSIDWMKDGQELRITWQCKLTYFINPFEDELLCDVAPLSVADSLFVNPTYGIDTIHIGHDLKRWLPKSGIDGMAYQSDNPHQWLLWYFPNKKRS